jgi:2-polyprenyl-3-methyl-5-hydroxy-6-metoxy-1,4-benzoquinol methylase
MSESLFDRTAVAFANATDRLAASGRYVRGDLFTRAVKKSVPPGAHLLDYGCGPGRIAGLLAQEGYRVLGVDPSLPMIEAARGQSLPDTNLTFEHVEPGGSDLPTAAYEAVVCSSVIEYVEDPASLLAEFHRALKPGGALVLSYSNWWSLWRLYSRLFMAKQPHQLLQHHAWRLHHVRQLLRSAGFRLERRPVYFEAAPFDKRRRLTRLSRLPWIGTLTLLTARRVP